MPSPPRGIQKGWLQVHSKESWQRRWCVLLPDAIVYHTDVKSDEEDRLVLGPSVRATPFNDMQAGSCNLSEERPCGFMVSFFSHIRDKWVSAYFDAEDPVTLKKWIRAIETAHWTSSGAHYIDDFSDYSSNRVEKNKTSLPDIDKMNWAAIETVPVHQYATPMAAERHDGMVSAAGIKRATSSSSSAGPKRCETRFEIDDFSDYASDNNAAAETSSLKGWDVQDWSAVVQDCTPWDTSWDENTRCPTPELDAAAASPSCKVGVHSAGSVGPISSQCDVDETPYSTNSCRSLCNGDKAAQSVTEPVGKNPCSAFEDLDECW